MCMPTLVSENKTTPKQFIVDTQNEESTKIEGLESLKGIPYFAIVIDQLFLCYTC